MNIITEYLVHTPFLTKLSINYLFIFLFISVTPNPSPLSRKKLQPNKHSPKLSGKLLKISLSDFLLASFIAGSRLSNRNKSPDRMSSSCYSNLSDNSNHSIMSQSLDPTILRQTVTSRASNDSINYIISEKSLGRYRKGY